MQTPDNGRRTAWPTVALMLACNDPDNGLFTGRVTQIDVAGALELSCRSYSTRDCPRLRLGQDCIILSGKAWPIRSKKEWVGNWCWNAYGMSLPVVANFLNWLRLTDKFKSEGGYSSVCDLWDAGRPIDTASLKVALT